MPIASPFYTSRRRQQQRAENRGIHPRSLRALPKTADVPNGLPLRSGNTTGVVEKRRMTSGRALLAEVAEGLVLADAIVAQLFHLAGGASEGSADMEEAFSNGLTSLTAMAAGGSTLARRLLGGSAEPVLLAEGLRLSLSGLSPSALGISGLCLRDPAAADAAVQRLATAREQIQAQLEEVDRADRVLEIRDQLPFFKAGPDPAAPKTSTPARHGSALCHPHSADLATEYLF
jgi:hypothetical protein